ncbi:MAG: hypothetical protein M1401_12265 [Chloroflexi bacterium]|nr:hypothetical protein [Chloroflexota bacterium]
MARQGRGRGLPELGLAQVWALAALTVTFVTCNRSPIALSDFWWHLKSGQVIATTQQIPTTDAYSFVAAGRYYPYHEWLGELYLYGVYSLGGVELALLANALLLTATAALVLAMAYRASGDMRLAALAAMFGMFVALANRDVRPQVLGFLFFACALWLLGRYRRSPSRAVWLLPGLAALWVNVHGSVVLGVAAAGLVAACELCKAWLGWWPERALARRDALRLAVAVALMVPALLLNPWGAGFIEFGLAVMRNPLNQTAIAEWLAPSIRDPQSMPLFALLLGCAGLFALAPRAVDLTDAALFLVFAVLALQAGRNSVWFGIVATPLLAQQLAVLDADWRARARRGSQTALVRPKLQRPALAANYALAGLLLGLGLFTTPWLKQGLPLPPDWRALLEPTTPVAAVEYVNANLRDQRLFHPDSYGGYLIWASRSRQPVFVDGRTELYPLGVWQDYLLTSTANDWEALLAKYGIRHLLLAKDPGVGELQGPLLAAVQRSPAWTKVYEDGQSLVYARQEALP